MLLTTNDCAVDAVEFVSVYQQGKSLKIAICVGNDSSKNG